MMRYSLLLLLALAPRPVALCVSERKASEELQAKLLTTITNLEISAPTFVQGLAHVAAEFQIPMGIEWVKTPKTMRPLRLVWRAATLDEVVHSLVNTQPGYEVAVKNGVLHVFPRDLFNDRRNFLTIPLDTFEAQSEYVTSASERLTYRLRRLVSPPKTVPSAQGQATQFTETVTGLGDRKVSFRLENVTARDVLDTLVLRGDFKIWLVVFPEHQTFTATGFRRILSPYNLEPGPDENQVEWSLLVWGMDPITYGLHDDWGLGNVGQESPKVYH